MSEDKYPLSDDLLVSSFLAFCEMENMYFWFKHWQKHVEGMRNSTCICHLNAPGTCSKCCYDEHSKELPDFKLIISDLFAEWNKNNTQWQPIDTLPDDFKGHKEIVMHLASGQNIVGVYFGPRWSDERRPTHWMPIPCAPNNDKG